MEKPPILNIKMVPAGVELVLKALNKLPREDSNELFGEILNQYMYEIQRTTLEKKAQEAAEQVDAEQSEA